MLALFSLVPPGQILWGSDAPYGTPLQSQITAFRCALQAGVAPEALPAIGGGQMARLVAGEEPLDLGPAPGTESLSGDVLLGRVSSYLQTAAGRMMLRDASEEYLGLARLACEVGESAPQAAVCRSVLALLDRFDRYVATHPPELDKVGGQRFPGLHMIVTAQIVAATPDVVLPPDPEPETVWGAASGRVGFEGFRLRCEQSQAPDRPPKPPSKNFSYSPPRPAPLFRPGGGKQTGGARARGGGSGPGGRRGARKEKCARRPAKKPKRRRGGRGVPK